MSEAEEKLYDRITGALVWMAAFCLATGVFLSITLLFNALPPTAPVAIGAVTIERYSKLRDYLGAALFFLLVPPLTVWLEHVLGRAARRLRTMGERVLFTFPYLLSPLFYLTTGKVGWILLLPVAFSLTGPRVLAFVRSRRWIRELFRPELRPYHALLFCEALSWLFYRYLATGRRLAHIPTLFLEVVFVALFLAIFWAAAILIARTCELQFGASAEEIFRRITVAALPLVVLPFLPAIWVPLPHPRLINLVALLLIALVALRLRRPMSPAAAWKLATYLIFPALIYLFSYASTAQLSQWIDLFHRGESIGPASDYLRGKVPFRDVFALHGMLEDGLLDSWLMELFGRSLDVAVMRSVILGSFLGVAIWFLGIAVFRSIPLALLCVAMGSWTTAENNRTLFQVAAVALFWHALRGGKTVGGRQSAVGSGTETTDAAAGFDSSTADRRPPTADSSRGSRTAAVLSGVFAGIALFFSYEIALYTIAGAFAASLLLWIASRRVPWDGLPPARAAAFFALGTALGAAPFVVYLAMHGAFDDFLVTSFRVIPNIIDAVWSLPFPDLVSTFRRDLNIHTLADFVVWEKFHLVLSPLTIVMAAIYSMARWLRRRTDSLDFALIVLTVFAIVAQRTAFGRASFQHQYFSAFLIGPLLVLLAVAAVRMLRELWRGGGEGTRAFVAALAVAAVPVIAVLFWIPDLVNGRLHEFIRYSGRVLHVDREPQAEEVRWRIDDVSSGIRALTRRGEPIFDFSNQPAFYFFADRPNPTRFYQVPILSPRGFQAETIRALEKARPKVVIRRSPELFDQFDGVTNDLRAQAVSAYLDDTYRFFRSVRGVELWTRRPDGRARKLSDYLALIRLPDEQELVNSRLERMVFPAVGSVPGVNGAFWQSDLTMHNPYREPLRLTLRYVTGERGTDRRLTLAPRQTLRWENVVRTLFQNDNSLGTLWVEHREGLAPVAVVKTSDVAHQASASVEQPLSRRDAATASTEHAELAIIGIPPAKGLPRRVNVGVVNLGTIPATFRVSARTRSGATAGGSVESGVPEDQVWLVNDIENELGMKLDETMTVRVTVIAGTGVAFATVVEYGGDSEFIAAIPAQQQ